MDSTNNTDVKNNNTNHLSLNNQIPNYVLQQSLKQYNRFKQVFKITEEEELLINSQTLEEYEKYDAIISSKTSQLNSDESALLLGLLLIYRNHELSYMNKEKKNLNHTLIKNNNNNDNDCTKINLNKENNDKYTNENLNSLDSMFLFNNLQSDSIYEQTTHKDSSNTKITDKDDNNDSNKENVDINNRVLPNKAISNCDDIKENIDLKSKDNVKIELNTKQDTVSKKDEILNKSNESFEVMSFNPLSTIQMNSNNNINKTTIDCDNKVIKTNEVINKNNRSLFESDYNITNKEDVNDFSKATTTQTNNNNKSITLQTEKNNNNTFIPQKTNTNTNIDKNIINNNVNNREYISNSNNNYNNNRNNSTYNNNRNTNYNYNYKLFTIIERLFQDIKSNKYKILNLIKNKYVAQVFNNLVIQPMVLLAKGVNKLSYSEKKYIFSISDFSIILATEYDMNLVFTKDSGLYRLMRVKKVIK